MKLVLYLFQFLLILGNFITFSVSQDENPLLVIKQGALSGKYANSRNGRLFYEFRAIPYGEVPRRFEIAVAANSWTDIRNATMSGPGCIYHDPTSETGSSGVEDCLDLDVFTPMLPRDPNYQGPMPTIVVFSGGGFMAGGGATFGPKYFMDENIILVNMNFRLGVFGLLNVGIEDARGNQALKDQVLALKWIQDNIADFGGDPKSVTITGESTGGGSVSFHTFSPMSRGLFSGAIMQSGIAPLPQVFHGTPPIKYAKMLSAAVDCPTRNLESLVACLRYIPAAELASLSTIETDGFGWTQNGIHLSATVETFSNGPNDPNVFISEDPFVMAQRGDFEKVPMIIGQMAFEQISLMWATLPDRNFTDKYNKEFGRRMTNNLVLYDTAADPCAIISKLKEFYLQGRNVSFETLWEFERMFTDRFMTHNIRKTAAEYAKHTNVYMYNFTKPIANDPLPPSHAYDVYFLFNLPNQDHPFPEIKPGDADYEFSRQLVKMFATFARDRKPGLLWGNIGGEWPALIPGERQQWLQIDEDPFMREVDQTFMDSWKMYDEFDLNGYGEV